MTGFIICYFGVERTSGSDTSSNLTRTPKSGQEIKLKLLYEQISDEGCKYVYFRGCVNASQPSCSSCTDSAESYDDAAGSGSRSGE
jgi:hypothetical protein